MEFVFSTLAAAISPFFENATPSAVLEVLRQSDEAAAFCTATPPGSTEISVSGAAPGDFPSCQAVAAPSTGMSCTTSPYLAICEVEFILRFHHSRGERRESTPVAAAEPQSGLIQSNDGTASHERYLSLEEQRNVSPMSPTERAVTSSPARLSAKSGTGCTGPGLGVVVTGSISTLLGGAHTSSNPRQYEAGKDSEYYYKPRTCVILTRKKRALTADDVGAPAASESSVATEAGGGGAEAKGSPLARLRSSRPKLALRDFTLYTLDFSAPLEQLQRVLTGIFEPLCHAQQDTTLRSQIRDLASCIRSHSSGLLMDFDALRFVHPEVLDLCRAHPEADVRMLIELLGPRAADAGFIRQVLAARNRGISAMQVDMLVKEVTSTRDEVNYWQSGQRWIERIQAQVQGREWKVTNRVLQHRADLQYETELLGKMAQIKDYLRYLQHIPFGDIGAVSQGDFQQLARTVFSEASRESKYPAKRKIQLGDVLVKELCSRLLELASQQSLFSTAHAPIESLRFLQSLIDSMEVVQQLYGQLLESAGIPRPSNTLMQPTNSTGAPWVSRIGLDTSGVTSSGSARTAAVIVRTRAIRDLLDEHCCFYHALRRVFRNTVYANLLTEMDKALELFATTAGDCLWDLSDSGVSSFFRCWQEYEGHIQSIDERVALLAGSLLANAHASRLGSESSGQAIHRTHTTFRAMRRPKISNVVAHYQGPLLELISSSINEAQEAYLDYEQGSKSTQLAVARFGVSSQVGRIMWERRIERTMADLLVKRDSVLDCGWHQLLNLQTFERRWRLSEPLAQYFGFQLEDLAVNGFVVDSEVHGTAYALAYLEVLFASDRNEWEREEGIRDAQKYLSATDPSAVGAAVSRLIMIGAGKRNKVEHAQAQEARTVRTMIVQRVEDRVAQWCGAVREFMAKLDLSPDTFAMRRIPVFLMRQRHDVLSVSAPISARATGAVEGTSEVTPSESMRSPLCIDVNFPQGLRVLLSDFRYLSSMKLISSVQQRVSDIQSFFRNNEHRLLLANTLRELLRTYYAIVQQDEPMIALLVTSEYTALNSELLTGAKLLWQDDSATQRFVSSFADHLSAFHVASEQVRGITSTVEDRLQQLSEAFYMPQELVRRIGELQALVGRLCYYSPNAQLWVRQIQPRLEAILIQQLEEFLRCWTEEFQSMASDTRFLRKETETERFGLRPLRVRIRVLFKEIRLESSAADWRSHWFGELNQSLSWLGELPILLDANELSMNHIAQYRMSYNRLAEQLPRRVLLEPLRAIEVCIEEAIAVESQWRANQQFLNLDLSMIQQRLGDDLAQWSAMLHQVRGFTTRQMDATQPCTLLGGIVVVADEAQKEVGRRLDQMNIYLNSKFRDLLEAQLGSMYRGIVEERAKIERCNVINDLRDTAVFLCDLPDVKQAVKQREEAIGVLVESEAYLRRQGYQLPETWINASRVRDELRTFKELVDRKIKALEFRRPFLKDSLKEQFASIQTRITELEEEYRCSNLDREGLAPAAALHIADVLSTKALAMQNELKWVSSAQLALGETQVESAALGELVANTTAVAAVWNHASGVLAELSRLGSQPFAEMVPRSLQSDLEQVAAMLDEFPSELRTFQLFRDLSVRCQELLGLKHIMQDLRSDAMSPPEACERHWVSLKSQLRAPWNLRELVVQDVWDSKPSSNAKIFRDVIELAQGERRLEAQIQNVASYWSDAVLDFVAYNDQVCLVRGWDVLLERVAEDLTVLNAMRSSPYFDSQHIVSTVANWEAMLNALLKVLELLMDVQRKWVYLDGVFDHQGGNAELRHQLPMESALFDRISKEFVALLPKPRLLGAKNATAMWFVEEQKRLVGTLERVGAQMNQIQRSLSDFLDVQRSRFPRFYFVGDDDLLEIMGNSKNPCAVSKHLRKMFTGIDMLLLDEAVSDAGDDHLYVVGMASPEGEEVPFVGPNSRIPVSGVPAHEWLSMVQLSMRSTLQSLLASALQSVIPVLGHSDNDSAALISRDWVTEQVCQVACLALQVLWTRLQESSFVPDSLLLPPGADDSARSVVRRMGAVLDDLAHQISLPAVSAAQRRKVEQLITVAVYQRNASRELCESNVRSRHAFEWLQRMRVYHGAGDVGDMLISNKETSTPAGKHVVCKMADASLVYGFEYLGIQEHLVQTPLTDRCFLTLTQAYANGLGGSPCGPAGTGKTETVKALGAQLGRHVLVFNCDDTFDYKSMGRILSGLCQVGAWGCFDEFNRLEERILSAVSQQIQCIQEGLRERATSVVLGDRQVRLHENVGIFITMNPSYAGRSQLPDNLKQLFRSVAMVTPDRETIAEVMLYAQGFRSAEAMSLKVVPLFHLCSDQLSKQAHYDFGLRALKSVLVAAGNLKRAVAAPLRDADASKSQCAAGTSGASLSLDEERDLVIRSIVETITPKLVADDVRLFDPLVRDFFPHGSPEAPAHVALNAAVETVAVQHGYTVSPLWKDKITQLYNILSVNHGIMLVGPTGCGKTSCWRTLMRAMAISDDVDGHATVIDPKALSKTDLFGSLDPTTRQWKDGVFTCELRRIIDNVKGDEQAHRQHWIVLDGDVDPEWVENLNSVLDDNKVLTLPNGERLGLPTNVRILFEVQDLRFATPATVSRCGMLWFNEGTVPVSSILLGYHSALRSRPVVSPRALAALSAVSDGGDALSLHVVAQLSSALQLADPRTADMAWAADDGAYLSVERGSSKRRRYAQRHTVRGQAGDSGGDKEELLFKNSLRDDLARTLSVAESESSNRDERLDWSVDGPDWHESVKWHERGGLTGIPRSSGVALREGPPSIQGPLRSLMYIQRYMADVWESSLAGGGSVERALSVVENKFAAGSVMTFTAIQSLNAILALLTDSVARIWLLHEGRRQQLSDHDAFGVAGHDEVEEGAECCIPGAVIEKYAAKRLAIALLWGLGCELGNHQRVELASELGLQVTEAQGSLLDYDVATETGEWRAWRQQVALTDIPAEKVGTNDTIIPTVDTTRHEAVLSAWLSTGNSAILCGPPGSGKTMSITAALRAAPQMYDVANLNFSSATGPATIIRSLEQYCAVQSTPRGFVMAPAAGKTLILFCDEINLPALDDYGTQRVGEFLRQLTERRGFFRRRDNAWVSVERVQFIGACNPPTDPGRVPLSARFLRWAPVLFVDFPTQESLLLVYETYGRAVLQHPRCTKLCGRAGSLAAAMVGVFEACQAHFTPQKQQHYVYSPRELSRWVRAVCEGLQMRRSGPTGAAAAAVQPLVPTGDMGGELTVDQLVRLALHEGLRIFHDRLVSEEEREWCATCLAKHFHDHFPDHSSDAVRRPLLFSPLLSNCYEDVTLDDLRIFLSKKLALFSDEEFAVELVVFDELIEHILRIDRVLRQPLGHVLLVGASGVGKTVISRFVAWLNHLDVFQIKAHSRYSLHDFEEDLREVMRRTGCRRESICFIFDESNILEASFLEYMNALLASGDVPGLFEGDEWPKLMQGIREALETQAPSKAGTGAGQSPGEANLETFEYVDTSSDQDMYRWFVRNVQRYLHVVFTMNPQSADFQARGASSPALFNRCTIDWCGSWGDNSMMQIAREVTRRVVFPVPPEADDSWDETGTREALCRSICAIHCETEAVSAELRTRQTGSHTYITPRHFIEFVRQLCSLYKEKRSSSDDLLSHLLNGIAKLNDTSTSVNSQKRTLQLRDAELSQSSQQAQAMLEKIVTETEAAKKGKAMAQRLKEQLQIERERINSKRAVVEGQLATAIPSLREAELALNTIKPEYLREIRGYMTPPPMVRRVLEAVLTLMGEMEAEQWDVIKAHVRRDDFIVQVKAFQPSEISHEARERVKRSLDDPAFSYEAAMRASKAAGPLHQWLTAQIRFAEITVKVEPMRKAVEALAAAHAEKVQELTKAEADIRANEDSLDHLKRSYQTTMEHTAEIKREIQSVSTRCARASTLLGSLEHEKQRWEEEAASFALQSRSVLGDCVLASTVVSYIGYFDEHTRRCSLLPRWRAILGTYRVSFREQVMPFEFLSTAEQRHEWEAHDLPRDDICVENVAVMQRLAGRYHLIIDPSGQVVQYLLKAHKAQNITKTSFTQNFLKPLEMAMRFGYPLLIEDAEFMDPVINPLLNHEMRRNSGHTIVRLGMQDVDMAPTFKLFLSTRDSKHRFSPATSGKVSLINFTVTFTSLRSQCLMQILQHERPDVGARRAELTTLRSDVALRLRVLEKELLTAISQAQGAILDNDHLITQLEVLQAEAGALKERIGSSEAAAVSIASVERIYLPVAQVASQLFFSLRRLQALSDFYQYDVLFLTRLLTDALSSLPKTPSKSDGCIHGVGEPDGERATILVQALFSLAYFRVMRSTFARHRATVGMRLAQLRCAVPGAVGIHIPEEEWSWLLSALDLDRGEEGHTDGAVDSGAGGKSAVQVALPPILLECIDLHTTLASNERSAAVEPDTLSSEALPINRPHPTGAKAVAVAELLRKEPFCTVAESLRSATDADLWRSFLFASDFDPTVPAHFFPSGFTEPRRAFLMAVLLLHVRRDAFGTWCESFLRLLFGTGLNPDVVPAEGGDARGAVPKLLPRDSPIDLRLVIMEEASECTPVVLVVEAGSDPCSRVELLARHMDVTLLVVALGSAEGFLQAEEYLNDGMLHGKWVLLKNVHLAGQFLGSVEKWLYADRGERRVHTGFRLILACEAIEGRIPSSLLQSSIIVMFETPPCMRSLLVHTIGAVPPSRPGCVVALPENQQLLPRLYLTVAWLHAVVVGRLQYVPMGWTKRLEITETEFWRSLRVVDRWVQLAAQRGSCSTPSGGEIVLTSGDVPWAALRSLISMTVYGGKIDNSYDQHILDTFCARLLHENVLAADFSLVEGSEVRVGFGEPCSLEEINKWVQRTVPPQQEPLQWLGLPSTASQMLRRQQAAHTVQWLAAVQPPVDSLEAAVALSRGPGSVGTGDAPPTESHDAARQPLLRVADAQLRRFREWNTQLVSLLAAVGPALQRVEGAASEHLFTGSRIADPVARSLVREANEATLVLQAIQRDVDAVACGLAGQRKLSRQDRELMALVGDDKLPPSWMGPCLRSHTPGRLTVSTWLAVLAKRVKHIFYLLSNIQADQDAPAAPPGSLVLALTTRIDVGQLLFPKAFFTATRQQAARQLEVSFEDLQLDVRLMCAGAPEAAEAREADVHAGRVSPTYLLVNLQLHSARLGDSSTGALVLLEGCGLIDRSNATPSSKLFTMVSALVRWRDTSHAVAAIVRPEVPLLRLPLYLTGSKEEVLETFLVPIEHSEPALPRSVWYQRGTCLTARLDPFGP